MKESEKQVGKLLYPNNNNAYMISSSKVSSCTYHIFLWSVTIEVCSDHLMNPHYQNCQSLLDRNIQVGEVHQIKVGLTFFVIQSKFDYVLIIYFKILQWASETNCQLNPYRKWNELINKGIYRIWLIMCFIFFLVKLNLLGKSKRE